MRQPSYWSLVVFVEAGLSVDRIFVLEKHLENTWRSHAATACNLGSPKELGLGLLGSELGLRPGSGWFRLACKVEMNP